MPLHRGVHPDRFLDGILPAMERPTPSVPFVPGEGVVCPEAGRRHRAGSPVRGFRGDDRG